MNKGAAYFDKGTPHILRAPRRGGRREPGSGRAHHPVGGWPAHGGQQQRPLASGSGWHAPVTVRCQRCRSTHSCTGAARSGPAASASCTASPTAVCRAWTPPDGPGTQMTHLIVRDDALWAGTSRGLFRLTEQGKWEHPTGDPPELRLAINTFYADSDGNFWVATNAGLARLSGDNLQQFFTSRDNESVAQLEIPVRGQGARPLARLPRPRRHTALERLHPPLFRQRRHRRTAGMGEGDALTIAAGYGSAPPTACTR